MNAFNAKLLESDESGLLESCDDCGRIIRNWRWMGWAFLTFDGKVVCNDCRTERLKNEGHLPSKSHLLE
jgi:hypothetical protein